jgi:hypothetical protein
VAVPVVPLAVAAAVDHLPLADPSADAPAHYDNLAGRADDQERDPRPVPDVDPLGLNAEVPDSKRSGRAGLSAPELTLLVLDWMSSHKGSDRSAEDLYDICKMMMPPSAFAKTFRQIKYCIEKYTAAVVEVVHVCPNDCIAYWDSSYLPELYRNAYRTRCPQCGFARMVKDPQTGIEQPAKVKLASVVCLATVCGR